MTTTKKDYGALSNEELIDEIKTLSHTGGGFDPQEVLVGKTDPFAAGTYYPEIWVELEKRIVAFLQKRSEAHKEILGTPEFPYDLVNYSATVYGVATTKRERCTSFTISIKKQSITTEKDWWITRDRISYADFKDLDFVEKYKKSLVKKRLKAIESGIDRCLERMGKLLEEQEKLQKIEGI